MTEAPPETLTLVDNWRPHPGQVPIMLDDTRFRVVVAGRRWGKSEMAAHIAMSYAWENPGSDVWWVGPTFDDANEYGFDKLYPILHDDMLADEPKWSKPRELYLVNGTTLSFRTSDRLSSLRGPGLDFVVMDEMADQPRKAWTSELRPTLSDTQGDALFIGTPGGRNLFHDLYHRGQSKDFPHVASWRAPSAQAARCEWHPLTMDEVDAARNDMPDRAWRQEYGAEFAGEGGGVFQDVSGNVSDYALDDTVGDGPYAHGWDFARHQNYTVGITLDGEGRVVNIERKQSVRWGNIQATIESVNQQYRGLHAMDATRDERIVEDLEDNGLSLRAVNFGTEKHTLIDNLAVALENGEIAFPSAGDHVDQLVGELEVFEYDVTRGGNISYGAPEGWHDDCVDALALAIHAKRAHRTGGMMLKS